MEAIEIKMDEENYIDLKNKKGLITNIEADVIIKNEYLIIEFNGNNIVKKTFDNTLILASKLGYRFLGITGGIFEISFTFIKETI